ncbi:hypothetical protein RhiXN_03485 [Rhizoctonia solani]|uniref:Uncharacterized protein n=1 Tax=Rhizoctonia solani TaxID=456999 RepID=A0A8H8NUA8_9AGAM|nr:uncharacterized protein RhiXN_03485 [Rhizoctonia solani]QRW18561.1 hypothetical protein RhiXN_03485 [Rhizoctonia solani]
MENDSTSEIQAARAASLSRAAESLAKAAVKLSEAARAMSLVAGALSKGSLAKKYVISGSEGQSIPSDQTDRTSSGGLKEDDGAGLAQPYRLLLDDEADILLFLCSLLYDRPKIVCYMTCGTYLLKLYKSLIDSVTETSVIIPESRTKTAIDFCFDKFLKEKRSIALFSEMDIPTNPAKEVSEYTVIHVGWPISKRQYVTQRRVHHTSTNILLAFSGDKELYYSGSEIVSQTVAWPNDTVGFRASVDILRPLFEERLSEISFEAKEEAYLDWIQLHSQQGQRSVSSWKPSELVRRANRFILGPLAYKSPRSLMRKSTLEMPLADLLPEVPTEFVTQYGLQPAVDEGLLRVEADAELNDAGGGAYSANDLSAEDTRNYKGSYATSSFLPHRIKPEGHYGEEPQLVSPPSETIGIGEYLTSGYEDQTGTRSTSPETSKLPVLLNSWATSEVNPPYHLLVDTEADVLLFTCAMMNKKQRIVCYMPCGPVSLKTYKILIEGVADIPVHIVESSKKDRIYESLFQDDSLVLLVPESLSPKIKIEGENSWVIHVGWPVNEKQYTAQRMNHQAQNNIIVACSEDYSLYPSGEIILDMAQPWPNDGASFRASVTILRPLYDVMLSEIPLEMKAQVYQDWIQFHSIHGPRLVEAWTPITIVERANDYLLEVLQWGKEHDGGLPLPEVSTGFVAQNGLEAAAQEGILVVEEDSDSDEMMLTPAMRPGSAPPQVEFQDTPGFTYFALDEGFEKVKVHYARIRDCITKRVVLYPGALDDSEAIERAVSQFCAHSSPVILLLASNTKNLPSSLSQSSVDCCIYWGFTVPVKQAKKNKSAINCTTTILVIMTSQEEKMNLQNIPNHPSASMILDRTENSVLATARNRTKSALISNKGVVGSLYGSRLYVLGFSTRKKGPEETARQLNQYAARYLLYGEPEDGSEVFPPVAGRPIAPKKMVEKHGLQEAVDAGLLRIK